MDYSKIKEVIEIDNGSDLTGVNRRLSEGWVLLAVRLVRVTEGPVKFEDLPIYILGRPSE
jgi:hypothetical protein